MDDEQTRDVIVARDVMVPMRDGVRLATDLYFPGTVARQRGETFPAVLSRTPYNKTGGADAASFFARRGYMAAVQDCRGRYGSEGVFFPFVDDPEDGYDTIEWIADHPSCGGKVGMYGCSYDAWVQFHAATQNPPSLATMIPFEGPINAYHYSMREGGALHLGLLNWAVRMSTTSQEARANPAIAEAIRPMSGDGPQFLEWASRIPWRRGQTPLAVVPQYEDAVFRLYFENNDYTEFWRQPGLAMDEYFDAFPDMPMLWMVGWFDWYPRTIIDGFRKMVSIGRRNQHLLVGPWTHGNCEPSCGDVHFGPEGNLHFHEDFLQLYLQWFNRWLSRGMRRRTWAARCGCSGWAAGTAAGTGTACCNTAGSGSAWTAGRRRAHAQQRIIFTRTASCRPKRLPGKTRRRPTPMTPAIPCPATAAVSSPTVR